jgi:chromosome segregation ATPase
MNDIKKEILDLKSQRDKQQIEIKTIYEDKQKLYEEIMSLKDQVSTSRSETKEKMLTVQFMEKEKAMLEKQVEDANKQCFKLESEIQEVQNQNRANESKLLLSEQQIAQIKT